VSAPPPDKEVVDFYARVFYRLLVSLPKSEDTLEEFHSRDPILQRATERDLLRMARSASRRFIPRFAALNLARQESPTAADIKSLMLQVIGEVLDELARL
jgi:hypothetical protein